MKIMPEFSYEYFAGLVKSSNQSKLPLDGMTTDAMLNMLKPVIFDRNVDTKLVDLSPGIDNVTASANNFYEGVTAKEVEDFYAKQMKQGEEHPVMYGLNSKLVKENGNVVEKTWKLARESSDRSGK
jgi:dipeptidyl-peptidase-3